MRYVSLAAVVATLTVLTPGAAFGQVDQNKLTVTNYKLVNEIHVDRTHDQLTYKADLINSGPALPSLTGIGTSYVASIVLQPPGNLNFPPTSPSNPQVTSLNTFTIVVDRTLNTDLGNLHWFFTDTNPVANAGPNQRVNVGNTVTLDGSGSTNPSGTGTLTYSWTFVSKPPGSQAALTNPTSVNPTFVADLPTKTSTFNTNYVIQLTVSNGSGTDTAQVTVSTSPLPPTANAGSNQTVKEGQTVTLDGSKSTDPNGDTLTYAWSLTTKPASSTATLTNATSVSPTFVADAGGQYIATLVVTDSDGLSSTPATVSISSEAPPVAVAGATQTQVNVGDTVQLDGSKSTSLSGNPLTYRWSLITLPAGSHAALSNANIVNPTFVADVSGVYVAQLIVNDGIQDSLPSTVTISTKTVTGPPTANAGPNQGFVEVFSNVTLDGSASSDPQGLSLTYAWSLTTLPAGSKATLSGATTVKPTFVPDQVGDYIAQLIVTNSAGLSSQPATVRISSGDVKPVAKPVGPSGSVAIGATVTLDGSGSTASDGQPLTYRWSLSVPNGSSATLSGATTAKPTFVADVLGTFVAQLIVNDGFLDSDPQTVSITTQTNGTITLTPDPLNIPVNGTGTLTVTIPTAPAPSSGGQLIKLAVLDPTVVSIPASVTIPEGSTSTTVTVTPLTLGGTTLVASGTGFSPQSSTINVVQPSITVTLSNGTVGITGTVTGTVTLSNPAPTNGVTVNLASSQPSGPIGSVTLPASINFAAGTTTQTFVVTGATAGTATITASSPGYTPGTVNVTVVTLGQIVLQTNASVAPGQTLPFSVSLVTPAPAGGVTINLVSSDATKLTVSPSVFIAQGATTPASPAQITGVNFGSPKITASAGGFTGDTQTVNVQANLSFTPAIATVGVGSIVNLTLAVSGTAPQGGLSVSLSSNNTNLATVPLSVTIQQGQSTVNVPVTGVAQGGPVTITAQANVSGIANATATINVSPLLTITTSSLPNGVVQIAYNTTVSATGGTVPYTFSATGLPAGLSISSAGVITGTPMGSPGTSQVAITVMDSTAPTVQSTTVTLPLTINPPPSITTTSLPSGILGVGYNATVAAMGGNPAYSFTATGLPAGLSISAGGVISGTPIGSAGTSQAVIMVTDSTNFVHATASATLSITIGTTLAITLPSLPNGEVNVPYTATVSATGGTTPYTFTATGLPAGLSISAVGVITGTPTMAGPNTVVITVTDSSSPKQTSSTGNITVTILAAPSITTTTLPGGIVGAAYNATVAATGGTSPYTFSATGLPGGLTISSAGVISGNPTASGTFNPVITIMDSATPKQGASATLQLIIGPPPSITTASPLPTATQGLGYGPVTISATGGTSPYTFSATGLPAGLSIDSSGNITGIPIGVGTATAAITATDSTLPTHLTATKNFDITVVAQGAGITGAPAAVGFNLETFVTFTLAAPPSQAENVTVTSSDPTKVLLVDPRVPGAIGCVVIAPSTTCAGTVTIAIDTTTTSFTVIAQGLASSGTVTLTASATGYTNGMAQVSLAPSAFVLSGPNGVGASFNSPEGTLNTPISVISEMLNSSGSPAQIQAVRPFFVTDSNGNPVLDDNGNPMPAGPLTVSLSSSNANAGTISPPQVSFAGGVNSATATFNAGTPGSTFISANEPAGFSVPSDNSNTVAVTIQSGGIIVNSVTVGAGLENVTTFGLKGAPTDGNNGLQPFLISVADSSKALLSTTPTGAGSASITLSIPDGFSNSGLIYVYGLTNSGTVALNVCEQVDANTPQCITNPDFAAGSGIITLARSGFVLETPAGLANPTQPFNTTTASGDSQLSVFSAQLDAGGNFVTTMAVAGGTSVNVNVTSSNTSVGTITSSPVTIAGGNNTATTSFHPVANGSTTVAVATSDPHFVSSPNGTTTVNVTTPSLLIFGGTVIGNKLEQSGSIILSAPAPTGGLQVTIAVVSGPATVSNSATTAGAASTVVTIPAGTSSGTYFMQGTANSGTVVIRATAPGFTSSPASVSDSVAPSAIIIGGPNGGYAFPDSVSLAGGPSPLTIGVAVLDPNSFSVVDTSQSLAPGQTLSIAVSNTNPSAGTVPSPVSFPGGNAMVTPNFTPATAGQSTVLGVTQPSGFTTPVNTGSGDFVHLTVNVGP
jgi:hypothetical protein